MPLRGFQLQPLPGFSPRLSRGWLLPTKNDELCITWGTSEDIGVFFSVGGVPSPGALGPEPVSGDKVPMQRRLRQTAITSFPGKGTGAPKVTLLGYGQLSIAGFRVSGI